MLILVLIPAASAMDSEGSFYQEYEVQECEEVVEEYTNYEVEYTQSDVSSQTDYEEADFIDNSNTDQPADQNEDAVEIAELNLDSAPETQDIVDQNMDDIDIELPSNDVDNIVNNIDETSNDELTYKTISVNYQGSIFISKYDTTFNYNLINQILYTGMTTNFKSTSLKRSVLKVLELKNNLLTKQDMQMFLDENEIDEIDDIIVCINNTSTDFAYSIDNSIIGDECSIFFIGNSCFLKFYPCFDAIFCCKPLTVEHFLRGDFS
ncbi:MAG: hypothetical protein IJL02_07035 [Methanobrevibacter sp.]|uniref:hypothetical protein n=1 Tax=Methanobrevibacter sp. TaxID=66852 RepID=UPI0025E7B517|nr:hypothetical protein [Methanobrevibacter sp.]MBQ6099600.1 hypothetical protein [Methanobrevibacter sp.]